MGYNFPGSPSVGAVYTPVAGGPSYVWDGVTWRFIAPPAANNLLLLDELPAGPTTAADQGAVYAKDNSGQTDLYYRRESNGTEIQLTKQGLIRGARQRVEFNFSGAASPWAFRGFPPGVTGFDLGITNAISPTAQQFYLQLVNSAGTIINTNYRSIMGASNAAPVNTSGYFALTPVVTVNCGIAGNLRIRKGAANFWAQDAVFAYIGSTALWISAGDQVTAGADIQGFNFGVTNGGVINGGNIALEYWVA